jgi:hypothetical protein
MNCHKFKLYRHILVKIADIKMHLLSFELFSEIKYPDGNAYFPILTVT